MIPNVEHILQALANLRFQLLLLLEAAAPERDKNVSALVVHALAAPHGLRYVADEMLAMQRERRLERILEVKAAIEYLEAKAANEYLEAYLP